MPISSALLDAVQVVYNQNLEPTSPVNAENNADNEAATPELLAAQHLLQFASSGETRKNHLNALLEAVKLEYDRHVNDESLVQQGKRKRQEEPVNSKDDDVPPEMLVAEYLVQLAWSCDEEEAYSDGNTVESSSESTCSYVEDEYAEEAMFPWYEEMNTSFHLDEFFELENSTSPSTLKVEEIRRVNQHRIKRRRLEF